MEHDRDGSPLRDGAQTSQRLTAFSTVTARLTSSTSVDALSQRLLEAFLREGVGVSIGVATAPGHARTADELTLAADIARLDVKGRGKRRFSIAA